MSLHIVPIRISKAKLHIKAFHRHHPPPVGGLFAIGVAVEGGSVVGVAVVGRPVSRKLDDGWTVEITRLCVEPLAPMGACSKLIAACRKAAKSLGYRRLFTYTLPEEGGASLRGAGMDGDGPTGLPRWSTRPGRSTANGGIKMRWSAQLGPVPPYPPPQPKNTHDLQLRLWKT